MIEKLQHLANLLRNSLEQARPIVICNDAVARLFSWSKVRG
ncbi:MAG: hypothetical protein WA867_12445 [Candidatus Acidiferrales bacterium]